MKNEPGLQYVNHTNQFAHPHEYMLDQKIIGADERPIITQLPMIDHGFTKLEAVALAIFTHRIAALKHSFEVARNFLDYAKEFQEQEAKSLQTSTQGEEK